MMALTPTAQVTGSCTAGGHISAQGGASQVLGKFEAKVINQALPVQIHVQEKCFTVCPQLKCLA